MQHPAVPHLDQPRPDVGLTFVEAEIHEEELPTPRTQLLAVVPVKAQPGGLQVEPHRRVGRAARSVSPGATQLLWQTEEFI